MGQKRPEADVIQLTLPNRAEYLGVARLTVSGVAHRMGFSYDEIEDIKLAVGEACTNAVQHANPDDGGETMIRITCTLYPDRLVVEVEDQGAGFATKPMQNRVKPLCGDIDLDELEEGGLGLYLIHALMDEVEIRTEPGVSVSMTKFVRRDGVAGDDLAIPESEV